MVDRNVATSRQYNLISAGLAFFVWGGWAWYVNQLKENPDSLSPQGSGLIQGVASCCITLFMLRSVTHLFRRFPAGWARRVAPAILTTTLTGSCLTAAHTAAGTADVFATVCPGIVVALCFNLLTCWKLERQTPTASQNDASPSDAIR